MRPPVRASHSPRAYKLLSEEPDSKLFSIVELAPQIDEVALYANLVLVRRPWFPPEQLAASRCLSGVV
jgi:hypothetical protein